MFDVSVFPPYVGFGRLDPKTITEKIENVSADYFFQGSPVHRITHDKINGRWKFKDIFNDTGGSSHSKDLKIAVQMHFDNFDSESNSVFNFVRDTVCNRGNIYFENLASLEAGDECLSFFPAGRMVILRLPIVNDKECQVKTDILTNQIPYLEEEKGPLLSLLDTYITSIFFPKSNGETSVEVQMFEYIVTLASLLDVVNWFCSNNLISKGIRYRMLIQDSISKSNHSVQNFGRTEATAYTIVLKGMDNSEITFEELKNKVCEAFRGID